MVHVRAWGISFLDFWKCAGEKMAVILSAAKNPPAKPLTKGQMWPAGRLIRARGAVRSARGSFAMLRMTRVDGYDTSGKGRRWSLP